MAGKSDARIWRLIGVAGVIAATVTTAAGEPVRGRSRELGIQFELSGGDKWCNPAVGVGMAADNASVYQPEGDAFLKMVGRIRAVINAQCPSVEQINVVGHVQDKPVFAAEMSRLTKWRRFVPLDIATGNPLCTPASPQDSECDKRIAAYATMTQLMRGETFAELDVTSVMEERSDLHLAWTMRNASGALKISHRSEFDNQYTSNTAFADANLPAIEEVCKTNGGQPVKVSATDHGPTLAYRSLLCRRSGQPSNLNVVLVTSEGDWFYLFSLWGEEPHMAAANDAAQLLVQAIVGQR